MSTVFLAECHRESFMDLRLIFWKNLRGIVLGNGENYTMQWDLYINLWNFLNIQEFCKSWLTFERDYLLFANKHVSVSVKYCNHLKINPIKITRGGLYDGMPMNKVFSGKSLESIVSKYCDRIFRRSFFRKFHIFIAI